MTVDIKSLTEAVKNSKSIRGVLKTLGLKLNGGMHVSIKNKIEELKLDTSHFTGKGWCEGKEHTIFIQKHIEYPLDNILTKNSTYTHSNGLKKKLLKTGLFEDKCYRCGIKKWQNGKLILQIHHIDNDKTNNSLENLTILCPNCHSQIPNCAEENNIEKLSENLILRVQPSLFKKFAKKCRGNYKSISEVIQELMLSYTNKDDDKIN